MNPAWELGGQQGRGEGGRAQRAFVRGPPLPGRHPPAAPLIHAQGPTPLLHPRPRRAAPGGRKWRWGGERPRRGAAPSQLSLLSPGGMSADFLKPDPCRPPARPPFTWTDSLGSSPGGVRGLTWGAGVKSSFRCPLPLPQWPREAERRRVDGDRFSPCPTPAACSPLVWKGAGLLRSPWRPRAHVLGLQVLA